MTLKQIEKLQKREDKLWEWIIKMKLSPEVSDIIAELIDINIQLEGEDGR